MFSIAGFVLTRVLASPTSLSILFFGCAVTALAVLLGWTYALVARTKDQENCGIVFSMRAHILLHLVPFSYVVMQFFIEMSPLTNGLFLGPLMLFFLTGRNTWRIMSEQFDWKMYRLFYRGNTGLLTVLPILAILGALMHEGSVGGEAFKRVVLVYSYGHALLIGIAVIRIEQDIRNRFQVSTP
ncbi:MAG: hypothetical protein KDK39_19960 [Leptospiraceae bacterium]|nr:hypothetical protein [Leptospiraceae bacterium]